MTALRNLTALVLLGILGATAPAKADAVADALSRWGIMGAWKSDCSTPPDNSHILVIYAIEDGHPVHRRQGSTWGDVNPVLAATENGDGSLSLVIEFPEFNHDERVNRLVKSDLGWRTVENHRLDGSDVSVRDGYLVNSGMQTPWFHHCR